MAYDRTSSELLAALETDLHEWCHPFPGDSARIDDGAIISDCQANFDVVCSRSIDALLMRLRDRGRDAIAGMLQSRLNAFREYLARVDVLLRSLQPIPDDDLPQLLRTAEHGLVDWQKCEELLHHVPRDLSASFSASPWELLWTTIDNAKIELDQSPPDGHEEPEEPLSEEEAYFMGFVPLSDLMGEDLKGNFNKAAKRIEQGNMRTWKPSPDARRKWVHAGDWFSFKPKEPSEAEIEQHLSGIDARKERIDRDRGRRAR